MPPLSKDQFEALVGGVHSSLTRGKPGGFTVKTNTGKQAQHGIAVSLAGGERIVPNAQMTGSKAIAYSRFYNKSLERPGVFLGAWAPGPGEKGHGTTTLDNTRVIEHPEAGRAEMIMHNQKAAYDLDEDDEIHNHFRSAPAWRNRSLSSIPGAEVDESVSKGVANNLRRTAGRSTLESEEQSMRRFGRSSFGYGRPVK